VLAFACAGALQFFLAHDRTPRAAPATPLPPPPSVALLRIAAAGEPLFASASIVYALAHFEDRPGARLRFAELDYGRLAGWLARALALDPGGDHPLLLAAWLYAQVPDASRQRIMLDFVHAAFLVRPAKRWRWLAHAAIVARHRLHDDRLALRYAEDIAVHAPGAPAWARQMRIFLLQDLGEREHAAHLLVQLLSGPSVHDAAERRFLEHRLRELDPRHPLFLEERP
jgi:hypothetical protein